jgi:protein TonB
MEIKKSEKADISKYRVILFLLGYCLTMTTVYGVINYKQYDPKDESDLSMNYEEEEIIVEQTVQEEPPKPKIEIPPVLEIVEDEIEIEEDQPELEDIETDDDDAIDDALDIPEDDEPEETNEVLEQFQVSEKAEFKGGAIARQRFIAENLEYPQSAIDEGIEGRVMVSFVVERDGSVSNVKILGSRRLGFGLEEAAIDVVKKMSGYWNPAKQREKPVRMRFRQPIKFQLN